jgi:hypothetical protein
MIAIAYLLYQSAHRPSAKEFAKALMLAVAFLFWAANQLCPDLPEATLFNDVAIALFVLDVFLVMIGWPTTSPDESFAETCVETIGKIQGPSGKPQTKWARVVSDRRRKRNAQNIAQRITQNNPKSHSLCINESSGNYWLA